MISFSLEATNKVETDAPVTFVIVLAISIITSTQRSIARPSIGKLKEANTTVAAKDAVPGMPIIPIEDKVVVAIIIK